MTDPWLPKGHRINDGAVTRALAYARENWQIYTAQDGGSILICSPELVKRWDDTRLLEASVFGTISFGPVTYRSLHCGKNHTMSPVEGGIAPDKKNDVIAFSLALKGTREILQEVSLHDALYLEQYSRLLPTWTLTPKVDDEVVLGTWIAGGVSVSTKSFRRLSALTGWMSPADLAEIISAAGFDVPGDVGILTKRMTKSQQPVATTETKTEQKQKTPVQTATSGGKMFSLPGRPHLETFFNEHVVDIILNAPKYQALGIEFPSAIVLHGPPGCGKTFAVERLVEFLDWPNYSINSNTIGSPYIHATSKKISEVFDQAIDAAPSVLVIDEMESFLTDRQAGSGSGTHHVEEVAEFLRRIPEAIKSKVLIIAMTNMIDMIDPAILRRGRFDHIIEVGMPSREETASLVGSLLSKLPQSNDLNIEALADALMGKPLSDAAFVVREAARVAAKAGKTMVDQESVSTVLRNLPKPKEKEHKTIGFRTNA